MGQYCSARCSSCLAPCIAGFFAACATTRIVVPVRALRQIALLMLLDFCERSLSYLSTYLNLLLLASSYGQCSKCKQHAIHLISNWRLQFSHESGYLLILCLHHVVPICEPQEFSRVVSYLQSWYS